MTCSVASLGDFIDIYCLVKKRVTMCIYIYILPSLKQHGPLKIGLPKRDVVSQPPFFRGRLRFGEFNMIHFAHVPLFSNTEAFFELCLNIHFRATEVLLSFFQQSFHLKSALTKCNPPKFHSLPLKNDGWELTFLFGMANLGGKRLNFWGAIR